MFVLRGNLVQESEALEHGRLSFIESDVAAATEILIKEGKIDKDVPIVYLAGYDADNQSNKELLLQNALRELKRLGEGAIIITDAYISTREFPPEKYYLDIDRDIKGEKRRIDIDAVLERESKMLEGLGFISINDYVQYEYKVAYIYNNAYGRIIKEYFDKLESDFEKEKQENDKKKGKDMQMIEITN